jgi:hypothetical protein
MAALIVFPLAEKWYRYSIFSLNFYLSQCIGSAIVPPTHPDLVVR